MVVGAQRQGKRYLDGIVAGYGTSDQNLVTRIIHSLSW